MQSPPVFSNDLEDTIAENTAIKNLVEPAKTINFQQHGNVVHHFFTSHLDAEGAVIMGQGEQPVGLVMRNDFYQKMGTRYGRDLFMTRPIKMIMNAHPLIVDVSVDIATIGLIAMNRDQSTLYDLIVVTDSDEYIGVVSIKRFMIELSKTRGKEIELLREQKHILYKANEAEIKHRLQIESKNRELSERNESIKNLLDNAGQGFLSFGADLIISDEYSLECVQIFRGPIGRKNFIDLIEKHVPPDVREILLSVLGSVFSLSKLFQQKVYLSFLPGELNIYDKIVRIEYKIIHHPQKKMMLILTNITERKSLENAMAEERKNLSMIVKVLGKQSDVKLAIEEFCHFVDEKTPEIIAVSADPFADLYRAVHTYKGDFAQLGLHNTAKKLHDIENDLAALESGADESSRAALRAVSHESAKAAAAILSRAALRAVSSQWCAQSILQDDILILTDVLGESFFEKDEKLYVSKERLREVEHKIKALLTEDQQHRNILQLLRSLQYGSLKDLLIQYQDYVHALADRLGKSVEPIQVIGDDVLLDKNIYSKFIKSLVHVFRNMIDHGIETAEQRVKAGKDETGQICCQITGYEQGFTLSISDDGRGIDIGKVRRKAIEKLIITPEQAALMSHDQFYQILFMDSFSTKENVTTVSGRGVGLAAVKAEVDRLGGQIVIKSETGKGVCFGFVMPLTEQVGMGHS